MPTANWMADAAMAQVPCGDPDAPAFSLEREETWTYRELHERRNRYANALIGLGVDPGDRIALLMGNSLPYMGMYFAAARLGAVCVRLNFRLTTRELEYQLTDSGTTVLCVDEEFLAAVEPLRDRVQRVVVLGDGLPPAWALSWDVLDEGSPEVPPVPEPAAEDLQVLMYTSGTTGAPKGAMWTHETTMGCGARVAMELGFAPDTVGLTAGPLYHAGAWESLLLSVCLRRGHSVISRSGGFDVRRTVAVMREREVTEALLYPFMIYELLRVGELGPDSMPALRAIVTGGDTILPAAAARLRERLPGVGLITSFGLTEGPCVTFLHDADFETHPASIGRACMLDELMVVGDDGVPVAAGETGEIWMRGAGVIDAYWNKPQANLESFHDGWCKTGDLGRLADDGFISIAGRKKDMIRSGGENVYPAEVEAVLAAHPQIAEIAVIGVPDERWLEVGHAVMVAASDPVGEDELRAFARERLAGFKCPKHFTWVDALPRNASGKILKRELRETYAR